VHPVVKMASRVGGLTAIDSSHVRFSASKLRCCGQILDSDG